MGLSNEVEAISSIGFTPGGRLVIGTSLPVFLGLHDLYEWAHVGAANEGAFASLTTEVTPAARVDWRSP